MEVWCLKVLLAFLLCPHQGKLVSPGSGCFQSHQPALPSGLPPCVSAGCISQELRFNRSISEPGVWLNHFCVLSSPKQCSRGILLFQVSSVKAEYCSCASFLFVINSSIFYLSWPRLAGHKGWAAFALLFNHISRFPFLASPPAHSLNSCWCGTGFTRLVFLSELLNVSTVTSCFGSQTYFSRLFPWFIVDCCCHFFTVTSTCRYKIRFHTHKRFLLEKWKRYWNVKPAEINHEVWGGVKWWRYTVSFI